MARRACSRDRARVVWSIVREPDNAVRLKICAPTGPVEGCSLPAYLTEAIGSIQHVGQLALVPIGGGGLAAPALSHFQSPLAAGLEAQRIMHYWLRCGLLHNLPNSASAPLRVCTGCTIATCPANPACSVISVAMPCSHFGQQSWPNQILRHGLIAPNAFRSTNRACRLTIAAPPALVTRIGSLGQACVECHLGYRETKGLNQVRGISHPQ